MNTNTLPGIVKIRMLRCEVLPPHLMSMSVCGALIALALPSVTVKFYGQPMLKWEGTTVDGARQEKATLEFSSTDRLPEGERLAFVVTVASGKQYLVGTREPKYPQINYTETTGAPDGDAALRTYKITYVALKSVLPCIL